MVKLKRLSTPIVIEIDDIPPCRVTVTRVDPALLGAAKKVVAGERTELTRAWCDMALSSASFHRRFRADLAASQSGFAASAAVMYAHVRSSLPSNLLAEFTAINTFLLERVLTRLVEIERDNEKPAREQPKQPAASKWPLAVQTR